MWLWVVFIGLWLGIIFWCKWTTILGFVALWAGLIFWFQKRNPWFYFPPGDEWLWIFNPIIEVVYYAQMLWSWFGIKFLGHDDPRTHLPRLSESDYLNDLGPKED